MANASLQTSLLCAAAAVEDARVLTSLLRNNVNVNAKGLQGRTALHIAAKERPAEHTLILLSHGANMLQEDESGQTALETAFKTNNRSVIKLYVVMILATDRSWSHDLEMVVRNFGFESLTPLYDVKEGPPRFFVRPGILDDERGLYDVPQLSNEDLTTVKNLIHELGRSLFGL